MFLRRIVYAWLYREIVRFAESPEYEGKHWPWAQWKAYMAFVRQVNAREDARREDDNRLIAIERDIRDIKVDVELLEDNSFVIPPKYAKDKKEKIGAVRPDAR